MTVILPGMLQAAATTRIVIVQFAKDKETEGRMYTGWVLEAPLDINRI